MFQKLKDIFSKKRGEEKSAYDLIQEAPIGITLKLKFKDPRKNGLIDPSGSLTKRYDPEDLEKRTLIGTLLTKRVVNGIFFLEIGCFKMRNGMRVERTYTLMVEEIEHVEEVK
jgi:hypothetical protein